MMDLYLQFGYHMKSLCIELIERWGGGTVILSPRDLNPDQLRRAAKEVVDAGGNTHVDPQLYDPRADHKTLQSHEYFPKAYSTDMVTDGASLRRWLQSLQRLNDSARTSSYILPGRYGSQITADWLAYHDRIVDEAAAILRDKPRLATICLSEETLRSEEQVEDILAAAEEWDVAGYYVVAEHPRGKYLVDHPAWLANLLFLCSGLKLHERQVVVGYCNHQMLCLAAAHVDAIASGSWINVRSFSTRRFNQPAVSDISQRAVWYYCPQALSEYKIAFLDFAAQRGILEYIMADPDLGSDYAGVLFAGALPSSTAYDEGLSFRHYLQCLRAQTCATVRSSFRETLDAQYRMLETAEQTLMFLREYGIRGQDRDFADVVDVNRAALNYLEESRGFQLSMQWEHL